jgi:hypothetical protein
MSHSAAHDILPTSLAKSDKRPGFCLQPSRLVGTNLVMVGPYYFRIGHD